MNLNYNIDTLERSGFYDKMNELIEKANSNIQPQCDEECQKNKKEQELYFDYQTAINRMREAPKVVEQAEEKYYVYSGKSAEYEKKKEAESRKEAAELALNLKNKFNEKARNIKELTESLNDLNKYKRNMFDLLKKTKEELEQTKIEIERNSSTEEIGYRSGYYDERDIEYTNKWSSTFRNLYWILVAAYIVIVIVYKQNYRNIVVYVFLAILILYPYTITRIYNISKWFQFTEVELKTKELKNI